MATLFVVYTNINMQHFFNNRYVRLVILFITFTLAFYLIVKILTWLFEMDIPDMLILLFSACGAGLFVYKFFERRVQ